MKINILTPSDNLTGGTRVIATYARLLQQRAMSRILLTA